MPTTSASRTASRPQAGQAASRTAARPQTAQTTSRTAARSQTAQTASRSQAAQTASTNRAGTREGRQQASSENVRSRQAGRSERTEDRQQGMTDRTEARAETRETYAEHHGGYYDDHGHYYGDGDDWDDGEVAALALGAAVLGGVVGYAAGESSAEQTAAPSSTVVYTEAPSSGTGGLPCTPNTTVVEGVTYYQCGTSWYTQAYGSTGVIYTPVPPPY